MPKALLSGSGVSEATRGVLLRITKGTRKDYAGAFPARTTAVAARSSISGVESTVGIADGEVICSLRRREPAWTMASPDFFDRSVALHPCKNKRNLASPHHMTFPLQKGCNVADGEIVGHSLERPPHILHMSRATASDFRQLRVNIGRLWRLGLQRDWCGGGSRDKQVPLTPTDRAGRVR